MPDATVTFIESYLEHKAEYNPAARRERYLRSRQLKGRQPGAGSQPTGTGGRPKTLQTTTAKQRREAAEARVERLNKRLDTLREVLRDLVEQSKARAGVDPKSKSSSSSSSSSKSKDSGSSEKTAKQKKEDAERAADKREKEKRLSPSDEAKDIEKKIADVRKKISEMKAELAAARTKSSKKKQLIRVASSVGASSSNSK